jgi:MerR family transcriptional regulator, light-induced transcriptional regulator
MQHTIRIASQLSGVSCHLIRIWERRYGALAPCRTDTNRRLYCDEDIDRLRLLKELSERGHGIGHVAKQPTDALRSLAGRTNSPPPVATSKPDLRDYVQACFGAIEDYSGERLRALLEEARNRFGHRPCIKHLVAPLIHRVGDAWHDGRLRVAHEHLHTMVVRDFLASPVPGSQTPMNAPEMVVTTPVGTQHELGALLVAATVRDLGVRVTYLGPNLPAEEIAACATERDARVVALSVVFPREDATISAELLRTQKLLPSDCQLWIGGAAAESYRHPLASMSQVHFLSTLDQIEQAVAKLS